jgi:hypothetical protein
MVHDLRERLILRLAVCEGMRPWEIVWLRFGDLRADGIYVERRVYDPPIAPHLCGDAGRKAAGTNV